MAKNTLTEEQREALLTWLAADYDTALIVKWFEKNNWPKLTRQNISAYRKQYGLEVDKLRKERRDSALNTGLALKEERVKRLVEHADSLDAIKWQPGENGRLYNEKAWRETLDDIASETGGRSKSVALTGPDGGAATINVRLVKDD